MLKQLFTNASGSLMAVVAGLVLGFQVPSLAATQQADGLELVFNSPAETTLGEPDLREAATVWQEMFDHAQKNIDVAQFYVASEKGASLEKVLDSLQAAGKRGVKIRFLMESKGNGMSTPEALERIKKIPNLEFREINYDKMTGGILHAKYLVVDGKQAFIGSQNFDWRALQHIHETGLLISKSDIVSQVQSVFNVDWDNAGLQLEGKTPRPVDHARQSDDGKNAAERRGAYLIASPAAYNPPGVIDAEQEVIALLGLAKKRIRVQVMDYTPLSFSHDRHRPFYGVLDNALRSAAARGVEVDLMVSSWNTRKPGIDWLKSLSLVPNVHIKIVTIPEASTGFIPFARVIHSKIMTIDDDLAWVGTSNWSGGYFDNSRNLEIVMHDKVMNARVNKLFQKLWDSSYASAIDVNKDYPTPKPGG